MSIDLNQHISVSPNVCGGKPCVAGTRIRVWDIYVLHQLRNLSAEEITEEHPNLSLSDVYVALTYYYDNKDSIDAEMKAADELVEAMKKDLGPGPLDRKLGRT